MSYEGGLAPNRDLLNVNFEGYKLSESSLAVSRRKLPCAVSTVTLKDQFSYQHVRAHTLHNHLHFDPKNPASAYWCSKDGSILKASCDHMSCDKDGTFSIETVFHLPAVPAHNHTHERRTNVTMEFLDGNVGVVCAGDNEVTIFKSIREGSAESEGEEWVALKSFAVSEEEGVMLVTACLTPTGTSVHILCAVLAKPVSPTAVSRDSPPSVAMYKWMRVDLRANPLLTQLLPEDVTGVNTLGTFQSKSLALYAAFQRQPSSGEELLLISETTPLVSADKQRKIDGVSPKSDNFEKDSHLFAESEPHSGLGYSSEGDNYQWSQTDTDVVVTFQLGSDVRKRDISCIIEPEELVVGLTDGTTLLRGDLVHPIDPEASAWTIEGKT